MSESGPSTVDQISLLPSHLILPHCPTFRHLCHYLRVEGHTVSNLFAWHSSHFSSPPLTMTLKTSSCSSLSLIIYLTLSLYAAGCGHVTRGLGGFRCQPPRTRRIRGRARALCPLHIWDLWEWAAHFVKASNCRLLIPSVSAVI